MLKYLLIFAFILNNADTIEDTSFEENIYFNFYKNSKLVYRSNTRHDDLTKYCDNTQPWLILIPGWMRECNSWAPLIEKFTKHRGGCIVCMDYYHYSKTEGISGYVQLIEVFDPISNVLLAKLKQFDQQHFRPILGYIFAMSFGSQLAINAGRDFGGKLGNIDACEPAGPLFCLNPEYDKRGPAKKAAKNVQVIHTSVDQGSLNHDAHQNWLMGDCGINQAAAADLDWDDLKFWFPQSLKELPIYIPSSRDNHNTCTDFYLSAFENDFEAVNNTCCPHSARTAVPANYKMGYMQADKGQVQEKTLFAFTYAHPPHNVPSAGHAAVGNEFSPPVKTIENVQ